MAYHVFPINDLKEHETDSLECRCEPRVEWIDPETKLPYPNGPLIVHNAYDKRERGEHYEIN